jgi:hypothetical protein
MSVQIRPPRPGDGEGIARIWLSAGVYYADLDPGQFQAPVASGIGSALLEAAGSWGRDHGADGDARSSSPRSWADRLPDRVGVRNVDQLVTRGRGQVEGVHADEAADDGPLGGVRVVKPNR